MRLGFTLAFNALHHFEHNSYADTLVKALDHWVIVEGASANTGSTQWCKPMPKHWHKNGHSIDGTLEYLIDLSLKNDNVHLVWKDKGTWAGGKDEMVNAGLKKLKELSPSGGHLWEIDADEQWNPEDIKSAEKMLDASPKRKYASFKYRHHVGRNKNLIATGSWGGGSVPRLWKWQGERFWSHEPPRLEYFGCLDTLHLPQKYDHYSYVFHKDVLFKDEWYSGHEGIYERWLKLQEMTQFPQNISVLFGNNHIGRSDTWIERI